MFCDDIVTSINPMSRVGQPVYDAIVLSLFVFFDLQLAAIKGSGYRGSYQISITLGKHNSHACLINLNFTKINKFLYCLLKTT